MGSRGKKLFLEAEEEGQKVELVISRMGELWKEGEGLVWGGIIFKQPREKVIGLGEGAVRRRRQVEFEKQNKGL